MVFSDCSSCGNGDDLLLVNKELQNISECNESSEYGNNDCDTSKNLDILNYQVILAERNESSQTASTGSQHKCDLSTFQFRSKSTAFNK